MTEAEWLAATDPVLMLNFIRGTVSDRRMRLFAVACSRSVWRQLRAKRSRRAIEFGEMYADVDASGAEAQRIYDLAIAAAREVRVKTPFRTAPIGALRSLMTSEERRRGMAAEAAIPRGYMIPSRLVDLYRDEDFGGVGASLFRDIFGNPFHPVTVHPSWLTSTVLALAEGVYADRAFDRLPILADALEDAGCDSADLLTHLRGDGPHVRGCWAVDLLLGKK